MKNCNQKLKTILIFLIVFFSFLFFAKSSWAEIIPADRLINWQGNVGVEGGIPDRTTICQTLGVAGQLPSYAQSVTASQINNVLSSCPSGQTVYLNAGTYTITSSINMPSSKTLRGAGMNNTIIKASTSFARDIFFGTGYIDVSGTSITSGYTKDSTQIVVSNSTGISVGSWLRISELNNSTIPVTNLGGQGTCTWCTCQSGEMRSRYQIVKVTGKNGNNIDFTPALYFDLTSGLNPEFEILNIATQNAGIEDLTVQNVGVNNVNIEFYSTVNSWVKNVKILTLGKRGIDVRLDSARIEVRDSHFKDCYDDQNADTCYGIQLSGASACLIENNIFENTSDGPMTIMASGNVIAYNYLYDVHRDYDMTYQHWADSWNHGAHSSFNLYEGNIMVQFVSDFIWGSNSHNTFFRNRFLGKYQVYAETLSNPSNQKGAWLSSPSNNYMNLVGNILGTSGFSNVYEDKTSNNGWTSVPIYVTGIYPGKAVDTKVFNTMLRHYNYDYVTNGIKYCGDSGEPGCQGGDASHTLPASLYLLSKPSWFGDVAWPPIGPDVAGLTNKIPAQIRYEGGTAPPDTTPPAAPTGITVS